MATVSGGTIVVTLQGRDVSLGQLLTRIETQMQRGIGAARQYDTTMANLSATQARTETTSIAYAQSLARGAAASGDYAGAQKILADAILQVTPNTTAASNAINQLNQTIRQSEEAATKQSSTFTTLGRSFTGLIGAYFAVTQAASIFTSTIEKGNQLETQQTLLRALSGSTENYAKNLAAAKSQQDKFGGSLADNIEGIANFANLSRRTGIEIEKLTNLARGLATIDPAQGFKGAGIALKEFFSGDITSLARRFEIPRDELNALKEIADQSQRFEALQGVLAKYGVTQELIAAQANTTAVAYEKLGGAATDALASIGQLLGQGLKPVADQATKALKEVTAGLDSLKSRDNVKLQITDSFLQASANAEEFNQRVQTANKQIVDGLIGIDTGVLGTVSGVELLKNSIAGLLVQGLKFNELTQQEFEFARGMVQAGQSTQQVQSVIQSVNPTIKQLEEGFRIAGDSANTSREGLNAFEQAVLAAAATGPAGAQAANLMAEAVLRNGISTEEATAKLIAYVQGLQELAASQQPVTDAHDRHTQAVQLESTALGEQAIKTQESAIEAQKLESLQNALARIGAAVQAGHLSAAAGADQLRVAYGLASIEAARLLQLQLQLAGANAAAANIGKGKGVSGRGLFGDTVREGAQTVQMVDDLRRKQDQLIDAEVQLANAKGNTARAIQLLRQKQQGLNKDSAEFVKIDAQIASLENKKTRGGGGSKSPKLTENEKLHNQLATQEDKFNAQMEDAERKHQQNLLKIIKEFAKKQLETERENEVLKRRSRFDFYTSLNKSNVSPIDRQAFAAAYEEAFAEAQKIAQSGRAKLAQQFLELRKRQIQELQELAEEEQSIKSDKDIGEEERKRRLEELEARRKLLLDAQNEERKQLLEGGDENVNALNEKIAAENEAYANQVDQIALNANRAADAKIAAAERAKKVVSEENKLYADQIALLENIQSKNGGRPVGVPTAAVPSTVPDTNTGTQPTPINATEPLPVKTDAPLAVQTPEVQTVRQFEMFVVRDQGVIDAIGDQTVRLEGKLDLVISQLNTQNTSLGSKLDQIRSAIASKSNNAVTR